MVRAAKLTLARGSIDIERIYPGDWPPRRLSESHGYLDDYYTRSPAMTDQISQPTTSHRAYGPWAWVGSHSTAACREFRAACAAAGVKVVDVEDSNATAWVVDMLTASNLAPSAGNPEQRTPRLFLYSSPDDRLLAHQQAQEWDDAEALQTPASIIVARLLRMDRRQSLVQSAQALLDRDELTGLGNRRNFAKDVTAALQGHGKQPVTVFILDIDHFKAVNDRYGHAAGDEVLKRLATVLTQALAGVAAAHRFGGEEFAWVTLGLDDDKVQALSQNILSAIRQAQLLPQATMTASIGYALASAADTLELLVANADRALYAAKAAGRDRSLSFTDLALTAGARDTDVQVLHFENVARVVTERTTNLLTNFGRGLVQQAQLAADEDKLTRVWNRRYMDRRLGREFELAKANDTPLSIALFDLDHFGVFNKTHGVAIADAVLADFAQLANGFVRSTDWFARYGGEEFVLVVRGPLDDAVAVAERIRCSQASTLPGAIEQGKATTTVSVGVAQVEPAALTPADVLQRCSRLLQLAKQLGRNRVIASAEAHAFVQDRR